MNDFKSLPFLTDVTQNGTIHLNNCESHVVRRLSNLTGQFSDQAAYRSMLAEGDVLVYEVFERRRPEIPGELMHGLSVVHPGKVGNEYFMTKGHFHVVLDTAEVYYCLQGAGYLVMETPEGDWSVEPLRPNSILYVPPRWAHRSVNIGEREDLVTLFIYPAVAGHDYQIIEHRGFRKLVIEQGGKPTIIDNPRWVPPGWRR
jgi:glucose-6-phosphate isomerase, archaeal